ncbi:MAG: Ig domain-containing protein [Thermoleophilaceae bacterium]
MSPSRYALLALTVLALFVPVPPAMAATTVETGDSVESGTASGYPASTVKLKGNVVSIDCSYQPLEVGFDYARDDTFTASGGSYDQYVGIGGTVDSPQPVSAYAPSLTVGALYHFRIVARCAPYGAPKGPPVYGADRTFVCCETGPTGTGGGGGGGGGGGTDTEKPTIEIRSPTNGAQYLSGSGPAADYECKDAGVRLGPSQCEGTVPDGYGVPTGTAGTYEFTVTATDNAGNTDTLTHTYTVTPVGGTGKAKDYNPKIADEGWFPKQCDPTKGTFDIQKCLVEGSQKLSKAAQDWWGSLWPAKKGVGVVGKGGDPVAFQKPGGGIIAVGAGNVIATGSHQGVIATGSGTVIATGSGSIVGCTECKVVDAAGKVIAVGSGNVIAVGSGNIINVGAGHRPQARAAAAQYATIVKSVTRNAVAPAAGVMTQTLKAGRRALGKGRVKFAAAGVRPLKLRISKKGQRFFRGRAADNVERKRAGKRPRSIKLTLTLKFAPRNGDGFTRKHTFKVTPGV